jgi:hypothetical protein
MQEKSTNEYLKKGASKKNEMRNQIAILYHSIKKHLNSDFLNRKTPLEKNNILKLSEEVTFQVSNHAHQSFIRTQRILPISLVVSGAAPFCSVDSLSLMVNIGLWLFCVDDFFDEKLLNKAQLKHFIDDFRNIIAGAHEKIRDNNELNCILKNAYNDLSQHQSFNLLKKEWANSISTILNGMSEESKWYLDFQKKNYDKLPSYEEYVEITRYTSGVPTYIWSMLTVIDDDSITSHIPYLQQMEKLSSTCIRLANDIESAEREKKEGKINTLTILCLELEKSGMPKELAEIESQKIVLANLAKCLKELSNLRNQVQTKTGLAESVIDDIAIFTCEFYRDFDFHTFNNSLA